jgi:hypothetical protein
MGQQMFTILADNAPLDILEHNHLQNTVLKLLQIFIQEQHDINMI